MMEIQKCKIIKAKDGFYFTPEEKETIINTDELSETWNVYTREPHMINIMKKLGFEPYKKYVSDTRIVEAEYKIPKDYVVIRKPHTKAITEERREKLREQMKNINKK